MEYLNFDHMLQHAKFTLGLGELLLSCMIHDIYRNYQFLFFGDPILKGLPGFTAQSLQCVCVYIAEYMD